MVTDQETIILATVMQLQPERIQALRSLGVAPDRFNELRAFETDQLQDLAGAGLDTTELYLLIRNGYSFWDIKTFASLRQYGFPSEEIMNMGTRQARDMDEGLNAGILPELVRAVIAAGMWMDTAVRAQQQGFNLCEVIQAEIKRKRSGDQYMKGRQAGYTHGELIDVLAEMERLKPGIHSEFGLPEYDKLRQIGVGHEEIMNVLTHTRISSRGREDFVKFMTSEESTLTPHQALMLVVCNVNPQSYTYARTVLGHDAVVHVLKAGLPGNKLKDFAQTLASNCRLKLNELLGYWHLTKKLDSYNAYLKLIDAKYSTNDIREAYEAGIGLEPYYTLRSEPYSLSHEEAMQLAGINMSPQTYCGLRDKGISHSAIMETLANA